MTTATRGTPAGSHGHHGATDVWRGLFGPTNKAVASGGGVAVAGTNNTVTVEQNRTPVAHEVSLHWRHVAEHYRLGSLEDRDAEIKELREFLTRAGNGWWGWHGGPWTGKTRLMAEVACAPPPGWRVVAFFVRRGQGANTQAAMVRSIIPQLADIAGRDHVVLGDQAAQAALLEQLLNEAIDACEATGERLLVVIDGLDEDEALAGNQFPPVLGALPLIADRHVVLVASRAAPSLHLPEPHPLNSPTCWHALAPVEAARAAERDARADMAALLRDQTGLDVAAFVEATGHPLTARTLASLIGVPLAEVLKVFDRSSGRSFTPVLSSDPAEPGYVFGHVTLQQMLVEHLDPDAPRADSDYAEERAAWLQAREAALMPWRDRVRRWGHDWSQKGWPASTPIYALEQLFPELLSDEQLVDVLTDPARHARIQSRFGSIAPALAQVRHHLRRFFPDWRPDAGAPPPVNLELVGRLLFTLRDLTRVGGRIPSRLPAVYARVGDHRRAQQLLDAADDPLEALLSMAHAYHGRGDIDRCLESTDHLLDRLQTAEPAPARIAELCAHAALLYARAGALDQARTAAALPTAEQPGTLAARVAALAVAEQVDAALHVASHLVVRERFTALVHAARRCREAGARGDSGRLAYAAAGLLNEFGIDKADHVRAVARLYADLAHHDRAREVIDLLPARSRVRGLIELAEYYAEHRADAVAAAVAADAARLVAAATAQGTFLPWDLPRLVRLLVLACREDEARQLLQQFAAQFDAAGNALVAAAYFAVGRPDDAAPFLPPAHAGDGTGWQRVDDLAELISVLLPTAPGDVLTPLIDTLVATVADALNDTWVRRTAVRSAYRLAESGHLADAMRLVDQLHRDSGAYAFHGLVGVARALAGSPQWADIPKVLQAGRVDDRDLVSVAEALAWHDHPELAVEVAAMALRPPETAPDPIESLADVAYVLGRMGHLELALAVAADEPASRRYRTQFWAADAAAGHDLHQTRQQLDSGAFDQATRLALLIGVANAALKQDHRSGASEPLTGAVDLLRRQPALQRGEAIPDAASLLVCAQQTPTAVALITDLVPAGERHTSLTGIVETLMQDARLDDARMVAMLCVDDAKGLPDPRQRIHACAHLVRVFAPHSALENQARAAAAAATAALTEVSLPEPSAPDYQITSYAHTASAAAEALARMGQTTDALKIIQQMREIGGHPDLHRLAPALASHGDATPALELLARFPAQNRAQPLEQLIAVLSRDDQIDAASDCLATTEEPGQRAAALNHIAAGHATRSRHDEAYADVTQAIDQARRAEEHVQTAQLLNAAHTLHLMGRVEEATRTALTVASQLIGRRSPGSGPSLLRCAQLLHLSKQSDVSRRLLAEAWLVNGNPLDGWTLLIDLDPGAAVRLAQRRWPTDPPAVHATTPQPA